MRKFKGIFYGIVSSATFGMIPLFALPLMGGGMHNEFILFYRFMLSAIIMGIILVIKAKSFAVNLRQLLALMFLGFCYAVTANLLLSAYDYLSSGMATTIHFLYPVAVTLIMGFLFGERLSVWALLGIVLAVCGVGLMCLGEGVGSISLKGLLLAIGTVFTYSVFIVGVNKSWAKGVDGHTVTFYVLLSGAILFGINSLFSYGSIDLPATGSDILNLVLLAVVPTMISDLTLVLAIQHIGSTLTSILGAMEPLTAVLLGVIIFGENFTSFHLVGVLLILVAVASVVVTRRVEQQA